MSTLTVVRCIGNWELIYVDGDVEYENHHDRAWPSEVLSIVEEHDIDETEVLNVEDGDVYTAGALDTRDLDVLREHAE